MLPFGNGMPPMGLNPGLIQANAYPAGVMHPPQLMPANHLALASHYGLPVQPWQGAGPTHNPPLCKYCMQPGHYTKMCPAKMAGLPPTNPHWVNFPSFAQPRPTFPGFSQPQPQMQMAATTQQLPPAASGPAMTGYTANHLPAPTTAPFANTAVGQVETVCLSRAEYDKLMSTNQEAVGLREKQAKLAAKNKRRRSARRQRQADSLLSSSGTTSASDGTADDGPVTAAAAVDATAPAGGAPAAAPRNYAAAVGAARGRSRPRARVAVSEENDEEAADQQQQQQQQQQHAATTTALFGAPRRSGPQGRLDISRQLTLMLQRQQSGSATNCKSTLKTFLPAGNPMERLKELWPVFCGDEPIPQRRADYVDILAKELSSHWQEIATYKV